MKCKAWQAELWGDTQHEPNVEPLFFQGHDPQEPKKAQGLQGWLVPCFRASADLSEGGKKKVSL